MSSSHFRLIVHLVFHKTIVGSVYYIINISTKSTTANGTYLVVKKVIAGTFLLHICTDCISRKCLRNIFSYEIIQAQLWVASMIEASAQNDRILYILECAVCRMLHQNNFVISYCVGNVGISCAWRKKQDMFCSPSISENRSSTLNHLSGNKKIWQMNDENDKNWANIDLRIVIYQS